MKQRLPEWSGRLGANTLFERVDSGDATWGNARAIQFERIFRISTCAEHVEWPFEKLDASMICSKQTKPAD
jgi:hypothetical protein